ncbi:MAG TPA: hypothetical protein VHD86_12410 [Xanthobacteraceae bacterium]|nr:hypothetical protein [Xanthobacteraceae bacterium]
MTFRDLYNVAAAARGHWAICGTVTQVADILEEWFVAEAADGFMILPRISRALSTSLSNAYAGVAAARIVQARVLWNDLA